MISGHACRFLACGCLVFPKKALPHADRLSLLIEAESEKSNLRDYSLHHGLIPNRDRMN